MGAAVAHPGHRLVGKGLPGLLDRIGWRIYPVKDIPWFFPTLNSIVGDRYISDPDYTFSLVSENILKRCVGTVCDL